MFFKRRLATALALLCCSFSLVSRAIAQDTRTVNEPAFPTTCTTLTAQQAITSGEPASETTFDTTRIQSAMAACGKGKAVELVASGANNAFLIGPLTIPTGVTLIVDAGVTVFGSRNPADYQVAGSGVETCGTVGTKGNGCTNLITASNTTGSGIMGYGIINGRGGDKLIVNGVTQTYSWWDQANAANTGSNAQNNPILFYASKAPSFTFYKITLTNSPMFHIKYQSATGFTVWGLKIVTPYTARNTDGIDPDDNVSNMTVTNSYLSDGDDNIAIGGTSGNPVQNITISNNHTYSGHGVSIGSYTAGGISNVAVSNLNMAGNTSDSNAAGLKIKSSQDRGGLVNNIQYNNVCIQNERYPLQFNPVYNNNAGTSYPQYSNIGLHNVTITSLNNSTYQFQGLNANVPLGLTFDNLSITGGVVANPVPQYAAIVLGPGPVTPVQLQQYKGTGVTYSGNITNPSEAAYRCPATNYPFLAGELFLSNATLTNQKTLSVSNTASVNLNAVVEIVESASTTPTSPIQFYEGLNQVGTATLGGNGTLATLTLSNLTSGAHTYTARYPADSAYAAVNFGSVTVNVNTTATTTTMTATPTAAIYGNKVALVATVATTGSTTPTGNVNFQSGGTVIGTATLDGTGNATLNSTTLPVGANSIAAFFVGSTNFSASDSSAAPVTVTITAAGSTTTVTAAPASAAYGSTVTVTSTVASATSGTPTGTVTIMDGGTAIGTATLSGNTATFTTMALSSGVHNLTSVYGGDTNFNGSTSATAAKVTIFTTTTTTTVGFTAGSAPYGSSVTIIGTINNGNATTATGNITFTDNGNMLATVAVSSSSATYTTSALPLGSNSIIATYSGDGNYTGSASAGTPITITQAGTTTTIGATTTTPTFGSSDTFTATVTPTSSGSPTGSVTFKDGSTTLGTGPISSGIATYSSAALTGGSHSITASYPGDTNYVGSTSSALAVTVGTAATTTTVAQPAAITYGSSASLSASVTSTVAGTLTGSVAFYDGTTLLGSGTLSNSTATYSAAGLTGGNHTINAVYSGDTNYTTSNGAGVTLTVNKATSTAAVSANPTTLTYGGTTTLTATVTPSSATGTITFLDGGVSIGTATLTGGSAQLTTGVLTAGSHSITVSYGGDTNYNTSTATSAATITVNQATSTTSVSASPSAISYGNSTVLSAVVSPGATGTVTFKDGTATLGTGTITSGKASYTATTLTGGTHSITAVYAGDTNFTGSTSTAVTVTVGTATTTTALTATPSTFAYGTSTTLTATLSNSSATGSVTFKDGTAILATITVANGTASYATATLTGGSHSITAVYTGDTNYATSSSSVVTVTVNTAASTTSVSAVPATISYGNSTILSAVVTAGATGTVTFKDGSATLGMGTLTNGSATFNATTLTGGTHSITAVYAGDSNYATSTSSAFNVTVNTAAITAGITTSGTPSSFGASVTFVVTLSNNAATGTVTFKDGSATLGTVTVTNATASYSTTALAVGSHSITGTYSGDSNYSALTTAALGQSITLATTTSAVSANPTTLTYGGSTLLTATVSNTAATGNFTFRDGTNILGSGNIANGVATFNATALTAGSHSITAVYSGDSSYATSTSGAVNVTVNTLATTTALTATPTTLSYGAGTTLNATVSNSNATGTVTFKDGNTTLGSGPVTNGIATYSTTTLSVGSHSITASYAGDNNYAASASSAVSVTVSMATTTSTIAATPANAAYGTSTAITVTVAPAGATGTVTFKDGSATLGTVPLANGSATFSATLAAGTHTLSATYAGDGNYSASATTSSASVVIAVANSTVAVASTPASTPFGTAVNLSASVTPAAATGTITFRDSVSGQSLGTVTLANGTASLTGVLLSPAGQHGITAMYSGDANVGGSTSAAATVTITPGTSVTTLTITPSGPVTYGTTITVATTNPSILGITPTGTIQFYDGSSRVYGPFTLTNGTAQYAFNFLMPGTYSYTAVYSGDANFAPYTSAPVSITVTQTNSTFTLTANPQQTVPGQSFNLVATASGTTVVVPTGSATFYNAAKVSLGTVALTNGVAMLSQTLTQLGSTTYTATYSGDADYSAATAQPTTVIVKQLPSATTVAANPTSGTFGTGTYTVSSTITSTGGGVPTGMVTYKDVSGTAPVTLGSVNVSGAGTASLSGITLMGGTHTIVAYYSGDSTYVSSDTSANPATITVATAATTTVLTVTPSTTTVGSSVTFSATVSNNTGTVATGMVSFALQARGHNQALACQLVNGSCSNIQPVNGVDTYNVTATYTGDTNFTSSTATPQTLTVTLQPQTITLTGVPNSLTYGAAPFVIGASSSSGLAVSLAVSGPATLSGSTITVNGAGTITITATQPGNATYAAAPTVTQNIVVAKAAITVTVNNQSIQAGAAIPTLTGSFAGVVNGDNITVGYSTTATSQSAPGTYPITATLADPNARLANYTVANTPGALTITANAQTIMFPAIPTSAVYGSSSITLNATASSKLVVTYTVTGPGSVTGATLTINGTGSITVTASQAGNNTYSAATPISQTISISPAPLSVVVNNQSITANSAIPTLTGTLTGVVNGDNITASYATAATQTSAPGTYPITAMLADPNARIANYTVTNTPGTLTITANSQTITFPALATAVTYGTGSVTLAATTNSNLAITYTVSGPATLTGTTLTYTGAGTVTVTASQSGNTYYSAATPVTQTVVVARANLTVTVANQSRVFGAANPGLTGTFTGVVNSDPITVSYATTATTASPIGIYPITATFADPNNRLGNYNVTNNAGTLTVTASATTITLTSSAATVPANSSVSFTAILSSSAGPIPSGTVTFLNGSTPLGVANINNGTATFVLANPAAATYVVTVSYAATGNYAAAVSNAVTVNVVPPVTVGLSPAALSLGASGSGTSTLTITPGGNYTGAVTVSCNSSSVYITCSASNPAAITGMGAVTSTISITIAASAQLTAPRLMPSRLDQTIAYATLLPLGALLLLPVLRRRRALLQLKSVRLLTLALFALAGTAFMSGCGSANTFNTNHNVPTGPNNVIITVTANGVTTTTTLVVNIT